MTETPVHRDEIDGLRALAVLAIMAHHAGIAAVPGGCLGVDIFFVISGYVITRLIRHELDSGSFRFGAFYARRARRILPALIAVVLVCLPVGWVLLSPDQFTGFGQTVIGAAVMVPNLVLWRQIGYFTPEAATRLLLHLWSLGVEEQFYLLFPLLLWLLWPRISAPGVRWVLAGIGAVSLGLAVWMTFAAPSAGFYFLPSRVWEFTVGAGAALSLWQPGVRARQVWALTGAALMVGPLLAYTPRVPTPGLATVLPVLGAALCLRTARPDTWVGRVLTLRPVVAVGVISYGTYLWHWPLLAFAQIIWIDTPPLALRLGLMGVALGLGWVSWRCVEHPFRRKDRPWRVRPALTVSALAGVAALGGAALLADAQGWRQLSWPGFQPAELDVLQQERAALVRNGICHFDKGDAADAVVFRAKWDCRTASTVGVYGDSNAADFAMILRKAGRDPMQMTGWACSIVPSKMRPDCRALADEFIAKGQVAGLRTVVLVNLWQPGELSTEALFETLSFWSDVFERVVLVAPLPRYPGLEEKLLRLDRVAIAGIAPVTELSLAFDTAMKRIQMEGLLVIDAGALFCADRVGCSVLGQGPLMLDRLSHLSPEGAAIYAKGLRDSGLLDEIDP
jgi:peptidoglycan/LPS O-acetylase OafA/YrhL